MGQAIVSDSCDFGWMAAWGSEMGGDTTLRGLLKHADRHMLARWRSVLPAQRRRDRRGRKRHHDRTALPGRMPAGTDKVGLGSHRKRYC